MTFPKWFVGSDCSQECSSQLPWFLRYELGKWIEAFLPKVPTDHQLQRMRAVYATHGVDITSELLERGDCGHGGDGDGMGPGPNRPGSGRRIDWNAAWQEYLRKLGRGVTPSEEHIAKKTKEREKVTVEKSQFQPHVLEGCENWWNKVS